MSTSASELIHDWNDPGPFVTRPFEIIDETLRDGLQSPSAIDPPVAEKLRILELMNALGIARVDLGIPGAGKRAHLDVLRLAKHLAEKKLRLKPYCAGRTLEADLTPIAEIQQRAGIRVEAYAFIGSSPIRQYVEGWDLSHLLRATARALDFCARNDLSVAFVTEDTTRSTPEVLEALFRAAIDHGACALVLCDTVGQAMPGGVARLVRWTRALVEETRATVRVEWHGHNDRGLAVINALEALRAGADGVHGCALGLGERVGNTAIDQLLLNLHLLGAYPQPLDQLCAYTETVARALGVSIPRNHPLSGADAFRTATGVHVAAIAKAQERGDAWLADRIYSAVPAAAFGKRQSLEVGPLSGRRSVQAWLREHGLVADAGLEGELLARAKRADRILSEDELRRASKKGAR